METQLNTQNMLTHRISSGLKVDLHFSDSPNIFFALSKFQFRASKYLLRQASEQYCKARSDKGPSAVLSSLTWKLPIQITKQHSSRSPWKEYKPYWCTKKIAFHLVMKITFCCCSSAVCSWCKLFLQRNIVYCTGSIILISIQKEILILQVPRQTQDIHEVHILPRKIEPS